MRFILFIVFLIAACSDGGGVPLNEEFKKTLKVTVNGQTGAGVIVAPKAPTYDIEVSLDERAELIKLTTCHREIIVERTSFASKASHKVSFKIQSGLENEGFCPINIGAFDKQGQHAWGLIEIKNEALESTLECDGVRKLWQGVSTCQSRFGLVQRIIFSYPVSVRSLGVCGTIQTEDDKAFQFLTPKGQCVYIFKKSGFDSFHRLTVFGYSEVFLKSVSVDRQFPTKSTTNDTIFGG